MESIIQLTNEERKQLLKAYRNGPDTRIARRAHVLLLLAEGWTWESIRQALFCSNDLIQRTREQFFEGGLSAVLSEQSSSEAKLAPSWWNRITTWITEKTPRDFGYFRSRWSCEILAEVLAWETGIRKSAETLRRTLHRLRYVWRRPRPVVGPTDPEYAQKLRKIWRLLRNLPADEVAVFQDEADVNLNPKIGPMWMRKGQQAEVTTPGNNVKRYLAGSLSWRTGQLFVSPPQMSRNAELFVAHLDDLRRRLRGYRTIHVLCDNAKFHDCRKVWAFLRQHGQRIRLHYLPKYAPETNPIERVWWHLHDTITRNHRCQSLEELLTQSYDWFEQNNNYYLEMRHSFAKVA